MTRINLLPWREARRAQQQREFITLLVVAIMIAAVGVIGAHIHIAGRIDHQEARNQYLRDEINRLKKIEREIKEMDETKARLLGRLEVIQNLQRSRPIVVNVFDELARRLPEDIFLTSFQSQGDKLTLKGTALSNNVVSGFMRELEQSKVFGEPALTVIQNEQLENNVRASRFELAVNRAKPKNSDESDETSDTEVN